jgi:coenzyme F420-0:L-glutamate ligase/coenzyme F420-1:gamma-L-glutamate ligase
MAARGQYQARLELLAVPGIPTIRPGDDLGAVIMAAAQNNGLDFAAGDVVVIAQKIVSKAENRLVDLATVTPSERARALAATVTKDPRLVELILRESSHVVRARPDLLIVEHRLGFVMANAGIDQSNIGSDDGTDRALLLPEDPDASARRLREHWQAQLGIALAVIINDSFGRAFRRGSCGVALGAAGIAALVDKRGQRDFFGRPLRSTLIGSADEIAAAASLLMGQADEGRPVVLLRGLQPLGAECPAAELIRPPAEDLFR